MLIHKFSPFNTWNDFSVPFRLMEDSLKRAADEANPAAKPWLQAVDILEDESQLVITADLPGLDLARIDIRLENGTLIIKGHRDIAPANEQTSYHRIERTYGQFARSFSMPDTVNPEKVSADYKNGVLQITLGKKELAKPRAIQVQVT